MERASFGASIGAHLLVLGALLVLSPARGHAPHPDVIEISLHAQPGSISHSAAARAHEPSTRQRATPPALPAQPIPAATPAMADVLTIASAGVQSQKNAEASTPGEALAPEALDGGDGAHEILRERIRTMIQERVKYPVLARKRGVEGTVIAGFIVGPEGMPSGVRLIRSSGHALLDREVLRAVEKASPYPHVKKAVEVPVTFRIERGY